MKSTVIAALVLGMAWFGSPGLAEAGMNHPPHSTKKFMGVDREHREEAKEAVAEAGRKAEKIERTASLDLDEEKQRGPTRKVKHKWGMP